MLRKMLKHVYNAVTKSLDVEAPGIEPIIRIFNKAVDANICEELEGISIKILIRSNDNYEIVKAMQKAFKSDDSIIC